MRGMVGGRRAVLIALAAGWLADASAWGSRPPDRHGLAREPDRSPGAGRVYDLTPRFRAGQRDVYRMRLDTVTTQGLGGMPETTQTNTKELTISLRTESVDAAGTAMVELRYESIRVRLDLPTGPVEFDSARPGGEFAEFFKPLVGYTMRLTVDARGRITSIRAGDGLSGMAAVLAGQFTSSDVVSSMIGPLISVRADDPRVRVGQSWTNRDRIMSPLGELDLATTQTLRGVRAGVAMVDLTGRFEMAPGSGAGGTPGVGIRVSDSRLAGVAEWDLERGALRTMRYEQALVMQAPGLNLRGVTDGDGLDGGVPGSGDRAGVTIRSTMKVRVDRVGS